MCSETEWGTRRERVWGGGGLRGGIIVKGKAKNGKGPLTVDTFSRGILREEKNTCIILLIRS
jgi:hypothetical protein